MAHWNAHRTPVNGPESRNSARNDRDQHPSTALGSQPTKRRADGHLSYSTSGRASRHARRHKASRARRYNRRDVVSASVDSKHARCGADWCDWLGLYDGMCHKHRHTTIHNDDVKGHTIAVKYPMHHEYR